jgi:hypothetical protein
VGARGLESVILPQGVIERGSLGRLRLRFDGQPSDYEPENGSKTRPLSVHEADYWISLREMVTAARPIADSEWNLVSMRLGLRILRRLPTGLVVTFEPNGGPHTAISFDFPLAGMLDEQLPLVRSQSSDEAAPLAAIDAFVREADAASSSTRRKTDDVNRARRARRSIRWANLGASAPLVRGPHRARGKWHKCPICRTPVIKGRFNPRIPLGLARPGTGSIRDLRGGYLSRLRETYLLRDPASLLEAPGIPSEIPTELWRESVPDVSTRRPESGQPPGRPTTRFGR